MIRYILKKDCPAAKAGSTLTWDSKLGFYVYDETDSFRRGMYTHRKGESKEDVENNPHWFEEIKEKTKEVFTLDDTNWQGIIYNIKKKDHPVDWLIRQLNIVLQSKQSKTSSLPKEQKGLNMDSEDLSIPNDKYSFSPNASLPKERIKVMELYHECHAASGHEYVFTTTKPIPSETRPLIKQAIEAVLNNIEFHHIPGFTMETIRYHIDKPYTQQDLDKAREQTWEAARNYKSETPWFNDRPVYPTLESYLLTLKEK